MSSPSTTASEPASLTGKARNSQDVVAALLKPIEVVGFWAAVTLPFLYMPLLLAGVQTSSEQLAAGGLVVLHVVSLLIGRNHHSD